VTFKLIPAATTAWNKQKKYFLTYCTLWKERNSRLNEIIRLLPVCAHFKNWTICQIFTKLGLIVLPLESTPTSYPLFPTVSSNKMADTRTCVMGMTLAPLTLCSWNHVWQQILDKHADTQYDYVRPSLGPTRWYYKVFGREPKLATCLPLPGDKVKYACISFSTVISYMLPVPTTERGGGGGGWKPGTPGFRLSGKNFCLSR
jgi:hypothetical protein